MHLVDRGDRWLSEAWLGLLGWLGLGQSLGRTEGEGREQADLAQDGPDCGKSCGLGEGKGWPR